MSEIRFVCERGHYFEEDPKQVDVKFTCQDGAKAGSQRGFFDVPETEEKWPRCLLAPLCPKPPESPADGVKEYLPLAIGQEPETACALNSEDLQLKCFSFLDIFVRSITYGRNATKGKELCDGDKPKDSKAAQLNCYNETFHQELLYELELACHANFNCSLTIPTVPLDPVCDGLKREARVEYICGKIRFYSY